MEAKMMNRATVEKHFMDKKICLRSQKIQKCFKLRSWG